MEHIISMTRQELQDQLDANSKLIVRLTEALRKSEAEKGDLLAAEKLIGAIADGAGSDQTPNTQIVLIRMAAQTYMAMRKKS